MVRRVPRLDEYLGGTAGRANAFNETASRTHVPESWNRQRGERPHTVASWISGASALGPSAWLDRSVLLFSKVGV